jgi:hypothetical protein
MSAPTFNILTQREITIDLSRPAMNILLNAIEEAAAQSMAWQWTVDVQCELDNFRNTLLNLLERSEPQNLDLIGD